MEPPQEPSMEDCCNSGCDPCIFDVYAMHLKLYKSNKEKCESSGLKKENGISELKYTTFKVVSISILSDTQKVIRMGGTNQDSIKVWWNPGSHFLYKFNSEDVSCTRPYTPIKLTSQKNDEFDFSIVIKHYKGGLVSKHLFELDVGDLTQWRGPYGTYSIKPNTFKRIIMIAQGTGIAPFISIIESILNNEDDFTNIFLYYCSQALDEILFRDELISYRSYWNFSYEIFLTSVCNNTDIRYQEPINIRRFSYDDLNKLKPYSTDQFLICGSTTFMKAYCVNLETDFVSPENIMLF